MIYPAHPSEEKKDSTLVIEDANVYAFRVFDIGAEINLSEATKILEKGKTLFPFGLRRPKRSILIAERPLVVGLEPWVEKIKDESYEVQSVCKLWSFGTVSVQLVLRIEKATHVEELCDVGYFLENDASFHEKIVNQVKQLVLILEPATEKPDLWAQYEDYLVFDIRKVQNFSGDPLETFRPEEIAALILGERPKKFANQVIQSIEKNVFQYTKDDIVIIHWSGALIYDLEDVSDIILTIEFAICSLLELRFYDDLLDRQLKNLYKSIDIKGPGLFSNPYKEVSNMAALHYIDISELVDRVGNAFKILGDYYYATVFRFALQRFYIGDWRKSVDQKLNHLAEVSRLFQGEVDERRNQVLTIIIILLIAIELLPMFFSFFK
jgi:hypothetical protein